MGKPEGGSAFPHPTTWSEDGANGMSLRDYFAGQALAGLIRMYVQGDATRWTAEFAVYAYAQADAMLTEREKAK